jgi:hypothetical protein
MCCGSVVLAGQNSNSSTTMQPNTNMSMGNMSGRRHGRRGHRKHRRHRRMHNANKNANT